MSNYQTRIEDLIGTVGDNTLMTDSLTDSLNDIISLSPPSKLEFMSVVTTVGMTAIATYSTQAVSGAWTINQTYSRVPQTSSDGSGINSMANISTDGSGDATVVIIDGGTLHAVGDIITFTDLQSAETVTITILTVTRDNAVDIETSRVLGVSRIEVGDVEEDANYRQCRYVGKSYLGKLRSANTDHESIFRPTDRYPYWSYTNGRIEVFPVLDSKDSLEIYHVAKQTVAYDDTSIDNMPDEIDGMVVLGASLRCLTRLMEDVADPMDYSAPQFIAPDYPTDVDDLDLSGLTSPVINASWDVTTQEFNPSSNVPGYTAPLIGGELESLTDTMDADSAGYGTDADFLDFSKWFSVVGELIEDEEDPELAQIQLGKIQAYVQSYSTQMQSNLNEFNQAVERYRAEMQHAFKDGELLGETNRQYLQIYQADIQAYQGDVNALVTVWDKNQSTKINRWLTDYQNRLAEYQSDIQNSQIEAQADIQRKETLYKWYQQKYQNLQNILTTQISGWVGGQQQAEQPQQQARRG